MPPTAKAAAGKPSRPACTPTIPNGSGHTLGTTSKWEARNRSRSSAAPCQPANSILMSRSERFSRPAAASQVFRCGPSPAKTRCTGLWAADRTRGNAFNNNNPPFRSSIRPANARRQEALDSGTPLRGFGGSCAPLDRNGSTQYGMQETRSAGMPFRIYSACMCSECVIKARYLLSNSRRLAWVP